MTIKWTGRQTIDADTFATVHQAMVDGKSVSVFISPEVVQDYGLGAAMAAAERKIIAGTENNTPPKRINITTADLSPR